MKTNLSAKELQTLYIKSVMHNEKQLSNKKMRDMGVILTVYPLRNLKFIAYIKENIYKGNTTFDRIKKYYSINAINQKDFTNKVLKNHTFDDVQKTINNESIKARNAIANLFNKHLEELNNLLD